MTALRWTTAGLFLAMTWVGSCRGPEPIRRAPVLSDDRTTGAASDAEVDPEPPPVVVDEPEVPVVVDPVESPGPTVAPTLATGPRTRTVDLAEVLSLVADRAPALAAARERADAAAAAADAERASLYPSLEVGAGFFRHEGRIQATEGDIFDVDKQNATLGIGLELEYDPADAMYTTRAAEHRSDAARHALDSTQNSLEHEVAALYYDLAEGRELVRIAETAVRQASELAAYHESRVGAGRGLQVDLLRARAHHASAEGHLIVARNRKSSASVRLVEILGLDPTVELEPAEGAVALAELVPDEELVILLDIAHSHNPDLATARALAKAADEEEDRADNAWKLPELYVGARYGGLGHDYDDLHGQEVYTAGLFWDLSPTVPAERRRARAERRRAEILERSARDRVDAQVVHATMQVRAARDLIRAATAELEAARAADDLAASRHREGRGLLIEVIDAELETVRAESTLASAIASFNRAQVALLAALGGDAR